ncbi:MAG: hypothetical protein IKL40_00065, partial [Clostridia bacterium]|nr:hypothetical protein [Clostridia bacterium]
LIFSTLLSLSSCKNISFENEEEETKKRHEHPKIPTPDYNGHVFTFLTDNSQPNRSFIVAESETGEIMSEVITKRNSALSQKYNITVAHQRANDIIAEVENAVNSGVIDFDAILATGSDLTSLAVKGMLYDLNNDDFSLDAQYTGYYFWDQNANEQLAFGNKLYFSNCAFNIHSFGYVMFFNKYLIEEYNLTSPYEMIKNNTWTIDNWAEMVKTANQNIIDWQNKYPSSSLLDTRSVVFDNNTPKVFAYSSEIRATTNDKSGTIQTTLLDNRTSLVAVYEKLCQLVEAEFCIPYDSDSIKHFEQDKIIFMIKDASFTDLSNTMEHEYGIVPIPKFDSDQKDYMTLYPENGYLLALPSLMPDPDRTVTIIEDMNYYSSFIINPTWFDVLLTRRYARDDESEMTLRTLYENRIYDIGLYNDLGGIGSVVLNINDTADCNVVEKYNSYKQKIQEEIDSLNNNFRN